MAKTFWEVYDAAAKAGYSEEYVGRLLGLAPASGEVADLHAAGIISAETANELLDWSPRPLVCVKNDRYCPVGFQCECVECHSERTKQTHCLCGAELMGAKAKASAECGDCASEAARWCGRPRGSLDERIAAAQPPTKDHDPTSAWGAGAMPGYEWPE